jgi:hypothetical protein
MGTFNIELMTKPESQLVSDIFQIPANFDKSHQANFFCLAGIYFFGWDFPAFGLQRTKKGQKPAFFPAFFRQKSGVRDQFR